MRHVLKFLIGTVFLFLIIVPVVVWPAWTFAAIAGAVLVLFAYTVGTVIYDAIFD